MEISTRTANGVAVITLNAPQRRNAFTVEMAREFVDAVSGVDADPAVAVTVVRGSGPDFCAGADLPTLAAVGEDPLSDESYRGLSDIYAAFTSLGEMSTPTIAAVHGCAVGAGLNLALATSLRIVATDARLISGFLRIGAHPGGGHFHLLDALVGKDTAAAMALFGEEVSGEDSVRLGLAWRATAADDVTAEAIRLAHRIAARPELARAAAGSWRAETDGGGVSWAAALSIERGPQMRSLVQRAGRG